VKDSPNLFPTLTCTLTSAAAFGVVSRGGHEVGHRLPLGPSNWPTRPPVAIRAAKRTMRLGLDATFDANLQHVMAEPAGLFGRSATRATRDGDPR
jgi:hypothetical protein